MKDLFRIIGFRGKSILALVRSRGRKRVVIFRECLSRIRNAESIYSIKNPASLPH